MQIIVNIIALKHEENLKPLISSLTYFVGYSIFQHLDLVVTEITEANPSLFLEYLPPKHKSQEHNMILPSLLSSPSIIIEILNSYFVAPPYPHYVSKY